MDIETYRTLLEEKLEEEERVELAVAARAGEIFEETGLFILCVALDPTAK